jgi:hypothetical protein
MSYAAHRKDFAPYVGEAEAAGDAKAPAKPALWRRILDTLIESRQKQVDRQIGRYLAERGGRLTDETERELTRQLMVNNNWSTRV